MCTVSFVPTITGFLLAMNRDEKRWRVAALPPIAFQIGCRRVLYPREPSGGTWLAVNDAGICLALINWHQIDRQPAGEIRTRGDIVPNLIRVTDCKAAGRKLEQMSLRKRRPFRLIMIDPGERGLTEWQWDLKTLNRLRHPWEKRHWYSSGYDEREAEKLRGALCDSRSFRTVASLRSLHASHLPERGPYSICMHRPDAATVSYSEVTVSARRIAMSYQAGAPCKGGSRVTRKL